MAYSLADDQRIDPRLRAFFAEWSAAPQTDVASRDALLALQADPAARARHAAMLQWFDSMDSHRVAPADGLSFQVERVVSLPDGNSINIQLIRPQGAGPLPCVYYIHGGAMQMLSCFNGHYQAWARLMAAQGVAVAMVEFRNALLPSSVPEVAPFPAGLNDCVSGLRWLHANSSALQIDASRIVVAGDSGGGNLALALGLKLKRDGALDLIKGLYALCPFIAGGWPLPASESSIANNGILMDIHNNRAAMAYGIEAFRQRDPLAWPGFATAEDVRGFPPVVIHVNELDPLRDEGVNFYRLLLANGVQARCRQAIGTTHAAELFAVACPELARDAARDLAVFCAE